MIIRPAEATDADGMSLVLNDILIAAGRTEVRDAAYAIKRYINHPARVACSVCLDQHSKVLGFQSLKKAWEGNPYAVEPGWGIIGTHISPRAARRGVGLALFEKSLAGAIAVSLPAIDATIGDTNEPGLAYCDRLGFRTYRQFQNCTCKMYRVPASGE
jgi:ribosomal protein S18 acetylase RimI-like enzyme